jgi:hypothetical protein
MEKGAQFENFDDEEIYRQAQRRALLGSTRNFVVEFGKNSANIAFDLDEEQIQELIDTPRKEEKRIRWM